MKANKAEEPSPAEQGRAGQMLRAGSAPKDARAPPRCRRERREGAQGDLSPVCPSSAPLGWWKAGGGPRLALPSGSCSPHSGGSLFPFPKCWPCKTWQAQRGRSDSRGDNHQLPLQELGWSFKTINHLSDLLTGVLTEKAKYANGRV